MGRETKILLAMLGLLAGVFVGVLSMKLLVPRPPAGAGPDIHDEIAAATPAEIVEPPTLSPPAAEPPRTADDSDRYASGSRFAGAAPDRPVEDPGLDNTASAADEMTVAPAAFAEPEPLAAEAVGRAVPLPAAPGAPVAAASFVPQPTQPVAGGAYVAAAGDSWWSLAERTYGDGRLYRALYAWNRAIEPRVSLVAGTPLQLPTRAQLATAWPQLVPRE